MRHFDPIKVEILEYNILKSLGKNDDVKTDNWSQKLFVTLSFQNELGL
jgi:hypothetical protein